MLVTKKDQCYLFTMRCNRERLPGDAPLPPNLMNIYSKKMAGKKEWENFASIVSLKTRRLNPWL